MTHRILHRFFHGLIHRFLHRLIKIMIIRLSHSFNYNVDSPIIHTWLTECFTEMVSEWSNFSILIIGSLNEKESENRKCPKLLENHPINQFLHEMSIGNGFGMVGLLFLDHRFPWWKRFWKYRMSLFPGNAGYSASFRIKSEKFHSSWGNCIP